MALPYERTPVFGIADKPLIPSKSVAKVAAAQMHVTAETSVADVIDMVDHTAKLGVKVIVLPEYAFAGEYILSPKEAALLAEQAASHLSAVAGVAAKYGCLIAAPVVERAAA